MTDGIKYSNGIKFPIDARIGYFSISVTNALPILYILCIKITYARRVGQNVGPTHVYPHIRVYGNCTIGK